MSKVGARFLNTDPNDPDHVSAQDIPYDQRDSVADVLMLANGGKATVAFYEPSDASVRIGELHWYSPVSNQIWAKYRDASGRIYKKRIIRFKNQK